MSLMPLQAARQYRLGAKDGPRNAAWRPRPTILLAFVCFGLACMVAATAGAQVGSMVPAESGAADQGLFSGFDLGDTGQVSPDGSQPSLGPGSGAPTIESDIQQLGISPTELAQLKTQVARGQVSSSEIERLCARMAAHGLAPEKVMALAQAFGLGESQAGELQSCVQSAEEGTKTLRRPNQPFLGGQQPGLTTRQRPRKPSAIERSFSQLAYPYRNVENPTPRRLRQFGYSLFSSQVSTFAPVWNVPVGDDYVLGPGDELNVMLWGRVNRTLRLMVQRDGTVLLPQVGPEQVVGLTFGQARRLIESHMGQITGVQVAVTMGRLRTIQVFVVGEVRQPGAYTVSALSRVSNALVAAGGVSRVGSLRRIELRRHGQVVSRIDLYQLLLHGDNSSDLRLEPQDVIFVPVIGKVAAVAGDAKRPAIYELPSDGTTLAGLLAMAGGVTPFGYSHRVQVQRVQNHQRIIVLDLNATRLGRERFQIQDGDLVKVYPILPDQQDVVELKGNVKRPGQYQWFAGMRVSDLLREGEGVARNTFFGYALIRRRQGPEKQVHFVPVDLRTALDGRSAGAADLALLAGDELTVFSLGDLKEFPTVRVRGEVRNPGLYPLSPGMRVSDLIYKAGGLKYDAYRREAELARTRVVNGSRTARVSMKVNLARALQHAPGENMTLERNDVLYVRQVADWSLPGVVLVRGEVLRPGPYNIRENERLSSLLERCGGFLSDAYLPAAVFMREAVRRAERERLRQTRLQMQQEVASLQLQPVDPGQKQSTQAEVQGLEQAIAASETSAALGRVVIHLRPPAELEGTPDDILLQDHDMLVVPMKPASVNVLGQVYNPTAFIYLPGLTLRDYLAKAGGPTGMANKDEIMLIKADGSVVTDQGLRETGKGALFPLLPVLSGGLMETRLEPGDTIYVPEQLKYISDLQYATQITTVIANSVMSLAVIGIMGATL